jgi:hypothetical protein
MVRACPLSELSQRLAKRVRIEGRQPGFSNASLNIFRIGSAFDHSLRSKPSELKLKLTMQLYTRQPEKARRRGLLGMSKDFFDAIRLKRVLKVGRTFHLYTV